MDPRGRAFVSSEKPPLPVRAKDAQLRLLDTVGLKTLWLADVAFSLLRAVLAKDVV